jgi:hypothetical protein
MLFTVIAVPGFTQVNMGGSVYATLLKNSEDNELLKGGGGGSLRVWTTRDTGKAGGTVSFSANLGRGIDADLDKTYVSAWWRPVHQFFVGLGYVDRYWIKPDITEKGFQEGSALLVSPEFRRENGYAGSILGQGHGFLGEKHGPMAVHFAVFPIDDLIINLGWSVLTPEPVEGYRDRISIQAAYTIPGAGTIALGFNNAEENKPKELGLIYRQSLDLGGFEGFEAGLNSPLYPENDTFRFLDAGLGARYRCSDFYLAVRTGLQFPVSESVKNTRFGFDVCPSYRFDFFKLYVPVGIGIISNDNDTILAWSVNPYIIKPVSGIEFYLGLLLFNGDDTFSLINNGNKDRTNFSIKVAVQF